MTHVPCLVYCLIGIGKQAPMKMGCWRIGAQYSAASFVETINSSSLTMDPDEFMARMVAAGIADVPPADPQSPSNPPQLAQAGAAAQEAATAAAAAVATNGPPAGAVHFLLVNIHT